MIRKNLLLFLMLIFSVSTLCANKVDDTEKMLLQKLANTKSQADSINILYDLFDLVPRKEKIPYGKELYNLATRSNRSDLRLDILRQLSQFTTMMGRNNDSVFKYLNDEVAKIPRSREQEETALFIRLRQITGEARNADTKQIESKIAQLIAEEGKAKSYPMNYRVIRLFAIVKYLTNNGVEGNLLGEYVDMLKERMGQANFKLYALNNILLTESANIYTTVGNPQEAVKADKELLNVVAGLEKRYHDDGRQYRNYIPNKYIIYRRMLTNYSALTPEEIEECYAMVQKYKNEDEDVARAESKSQLAELAYSMAKKNYAHALPIIKKTLDNEKQPAKRRQLLRWMQIAAEGIGDKDTEIDALKQYNAMLVHRDTSAHSDRARELDIRTRVNELKADKAYLQIEKEKEEKESMQRMMTFIMVGWIIFALILFIMLFYWARYRAASIRVRQFVDNLDNECHYLKEQHYRDYLHPVHDDQRVELEHKRYITRRKRKGGIIEMLNYILNDMLYISSIGKVGRGKFTHPVSVKQIVDDESAIARANQTSGAQFEVITPDEDIEMRTDSECLEYVLHHIFYAANRVAEGGVIRLEVRENEKKGNVDFIFTNTSVYVPEGNEDVMFDSFIDVTRMVDRNDGGLFLARLNALLINSNLYLDREFKEGSRYIFSVPKNMR